LYAIEMHSTSCHVWELALKVWIPMGLEDSENIICNLKYLLINLPKCWIWLITVDEENDGSIMTLKLVFFAIFLIPLIIYQIVDLLSTPNRHLDSAKSD
jgi:hypothetical protein